MEQDDYQKINQELITIIDDLLNSGDWEASLFLRTAQKKLQALLEKAKSIDKQLHTNTSLSHEDEHKLRLNEGYVKIFISIYQSDPYNIIKWESTLKSIREYSINRPIYRNEEHIQEMIRSKQGSANEGYVVLYIQSNDIIPPYTGKIAKDRWGHELLTVKDNSLQPENIVEFVHQARRYTFSNGKLSLISDNS